MFRRNWSIRRWLNEMVRLSWLTSLDAMISAKPMPFRGHTSAKLWPCGARQSHVVASRRDVYDGIFLILFLLIRMIMTLPRMMDKHGKVLHWRLKSKSFCPDPLSRAARSLLSHRGTCAGFWAIPLLALSSSNRSNCAGSWWRLHKRRRRLQLSPRSFGFGPCPEPRRGPGHIGQYANCKLYCSLTIMCSTFVRSLYRFH
jgi:hypothetical protein